MTIEVLFEQIGEGDVKAGKWTREVEPAEIVRHGGLKAWLLNLYRGEAHRLKKEWPCKDLLLVSIPERLDGVPEIKTHIWV